MKNPDATAGSGAGPEVTLYSDGAVRGISGPIIVPTCSTFTRIPDTPFIDSRGEKLPGAFCPTDADIKSFQAEFSRARIPGSNGPYREMSRTALLDIHSLRHPNGAVQGAASPYWAFVWPRDNALVVVALALCDQLHEAWASLAYVYSVQEADGQWEARYLPDGSGRVPDARGRQDDGIGYTLWATWILAQMSPKPLRDSQLPSLRAGILKAVCAARSVLDVHTGLPRTSQDYWEMDQDEPSLGVAAPLAIGLRAGAALADLLNEQGVRRDADSTANALFSTISNVYGPRGFERFPSGGGLDASVVFLLPPFVPDVVNGRPEAIVGARRAWDASRTRLQVANGGLRPGEQWPDASTAWNPQVSLFALVAAANGEHQIAHDYLSWMNEHRTRLGSLPEKVTAHGHPAAVAPIATVAAAVLIALALLDGRELPSLPDPTSPS